LWAITHSKWDFSNKLFGLNKEQKESLDQGLDKN